MLALRDVAAASANTHRWRLDRSKKEVSDRVVFPTAKMTCCLSSCTSKSDSCDGEKQPVVRCRRPGVSSSRNGVNLFEVGQEHQQRGRVGGAPDAGVASLLLRNRKRASESVRAYGRMLVTNDDKKRE